MMMEICGDNRFEIIAKAKEHLLEATNIADSEDEMKVLDSFLFRCWQMGWLDRYDDHKDEPQTENLFTDRDGDVWEWRGDAWYCISGDEPQTEEEILREQCRAFMGIVEQTERNE